MSISGLVRVESRTAPFDRIVAGLPLLVRAVLVLKQAGLAPIRVLAPDSETTRVRSILATRALDEVEIVSVCASQEPTLVLPHDVICDPSVIRALSAVPGTAVAVRAGVALGPERWAEAEGPPTPVEVGAGLALLIDGPDAETRATQALFESCRKPVDGIISRHLNRHISIFVSKRIVDSSITPNMTTVATFFIGLFAAAAVSRGGYAWTLLGAGLLQVNSILDGVDGELARVRHQHSHLGQWLDTVSDDLVNVAFWAALGLGAAGLPHGQLLMRAGLVAAAAQLLLAVTYWIELHAIGSGDAYDIDWWFRRAPPTGLRGKALAALMCVPKKDFFIFFCLGCALFGVLPQVLPLIAGAVTAAAAAALVRAVARVAKNSGLRAVVARTELDNLSTQRSNR